MKDEFDMRGLPNTTETLIAKRAAVARFQADV
jgi:hypothetical protein